MFVLWSAQNFRLKSHNAKAFICFIVGVVSIITLGLIGHQQLTSKKTGSRKQLIHHTYESYENWLRSEIQANFSGKSIKSYLKLLTETPHVAGTPQNLRVAEKIAKIWRQQGLQAVHLAQYDKVLLSYPEYNNPNKALLRDAAGRIRFLSEGRSKVIVPSEQGAPGAGVRFNAYAATGTATGKLVYCNYGSPRDFQTLKQYNVDLNGKIAIIRYGQNWRGEKVFLAEKHGAIGVILYSDPADDAKTYQRDVYPNSVWMPPTGAQRGSLLMVDGDPLTPLYPSNNYTYRSKTVSQLWKEKTVPSIPVLPISYGDAFQFLKNLGGRRAPSNWQGGLNFTYRLGSVFRFQNWEAEISVRSYLQPKTIQNVIGYIPGVIEPDRYVILGNHYDAWVYGAVDPNSATAVMLELSRVLMLFVNESIWFPDRTIIFCAWDAEEYGLIGSTEWIEENLPLLQSRTIALLNVDLIPGNITLHMETVPSLYRLAVQAAASVPNPNEQEVEMGRETMYDSWNFYRPGNLSWQPEIPHIPAPGGGSDHKNFLRYAGIPIMNFAYENASGQHYPLYHTLYETLFLVDNLMDRDLFKIHVGLGQFWAELVYRLSSSNVLPFNLTDYSLVLNMAAGKLRARFAKFRVPNSAQAQLEYLQNALTRLTNSTSQFIQEIFQNFGYSNAINMLNERLRLFEHCFINPHGINNSRSPYERHVIYGSNPDNSYKAQLFPGIYLEFQLFKHAKTYQERHEAIKKLCHQISIAQYSVECAIKLLATSI